ncbi:hypothetical protein QTP88_008514 [Uroleucon formosanum]
MAERRVHKPSYCRGHQAAANDKDFMELALLPFEFLNVNGEMVSHIVVPITGDGACLFNSISYLMYGTEQMAREEHKLIVSHVTKNWMECSIMSHDNNGDNNGHNNGDNNGDNYMSSAEYLVDMSQLYTYGGLCEMVAAGQLFHYVFEVSAIISSMSVLVLKVTQC